MILKKGKSLEKAENIRILIDNIKISENDADGPNASSIILENNSLKMPVQV